MDENENEDSAPEFRGHCEDAPCEDAPCCGCCGQVEFAEFEPEMDERDFKPEDEQDDEPSDMSDGEADADALASAGWGTDEDYRGEDSHLDSFWESQTECDMGGGDW
jgi:hypothetical protein